jgi:hypothetical protein
MVMITLQAPLSVFARCVSALPGSVVSMLITRVGLSGSFHLLSACWSAIVDPAQYRGRHTNRLTWKPLGPDGATLHARAAGHIEDLLRRALANAKP